MYIRFSITKKMVQIYEYSNEIMCVVDIEFFLKNQNHILIDFFIKCKFIKHYTQGICKKSNERLTWRTNMKLILILDLANF